MKILHLTSHLNVGGVSSHILSLSAALTQRGHICRIASEGGQLESEAAAMGLTHWPVPLHTSMEFSPQVLSGAWELADRLSSHGVDVLHAHTRVGQVVAGFLARRLRIPYVATWHGFFRPNLGRTLWPCTGDLTIAVSEPVREHLRRDFGVPEQRIRLIPHGIDTEVFSAPVEPARQQQLRTLAGIPPQARVIGTVARLVASKGVDQLIHSLALIRPAMPDAHLLIVGDGEERGRLQELAVSLKLADVVHFAGALPHTRTALSLMQVFVFLPAAEEGFGLSLLEAMASGRPVVAVRRGGGASWLLREIGVGTQVEPGDAAGMAHAITQLLRNGEQACRSAGVARAVVTERYAIGRMVESVEAVYRDVIRGVTLEDGGNSRT